MKFEIKCECPLQTFHNLLVKLEKLQINFCKGKTAHSEFSVGAIVDDLNQIEHETKDQDLLTLKHL